MTAMPALLLVATAWAGDPEAHSSAMIQAANQVAAKEEFALGIGPPLVGGVATQGMFTIFTDGTIDCPYTAATAAYGAGCAYNSVNGRAINEPDAWQCVDSNQPPRINSLNSSLAPGQAKLAALLGPTVSELAMACNWNHFTDNPSLVTDGNHNTQAAHELVWDWAEEIVTSIELNGATDEWRCDDMTWAAYYERVGNSLHYVQDSACEHHDVGNQVCTPTNLLPMFSTSPIFSYVAAHDCMVWLDETFHGIVGPEKPYLCDEAVVVDDFGDGSVVLNGNMRTLGNACGIAPDIMDGAPPAPLELQTPMLSLGCMGLERTLRHHCLLDRPKTLECNGPPDDHEGVYDGIAYCEGERFSGGGQDFLSGAIEASVPVIEEAARRWADVCKQPDDPCDTDQCTAWCRGTVGAEGASSPTQGYCTTAAPTGDCQLHECTCGEQDACGAAGDACCVTGDDCIDDLECNNATGRCVPEGEAECDGTDEFQNGDFSEDLAYWGSFSSLVEYPPVIADSLSYGCYMEQWGNPFVAMIVFGSATAYIEQTFEVPKEASTVSLRTWNALDPVLAEFSIFEDGEETILGSLTPASTQALEDPEDPFSVICTGNTDTPASYSISDFAGKTVTLRLSAIGPFLFNGTILMIDDVVIE